MRIRRWRSMVLLLPTCALFCADSPAPGACSGCEPQPDRGPLAATMIVSGAWSGAIALEGEWLHWSEDDGKRELRLHGSAEGATAEVAVQVAPGVEVGTPVGFGGGATGLSGRVDVGAAVGGYVAAPSLLASEATVVYTSLSPPQGTLHAVLVPALSYYQNTPGPEGTTVVVDVAF